MFFSRISFKQHQKYCLYLSYGPMGVPFEGYVHLVEQEKVHWGWIKSVGRLGNYCNVIQDHEVVLGYKTGFFCTFGMHLVQIFLICESSVMMVCIIILSIPTWSVIIQTLNHQSKFNTSQIHCTLSLFLFLDVSILGGGGAFSTLNVLDHL